MRFIIFISLLFITLSVSAQRVMTYNIRNSHTNDGVNKWSARKQSLANVVLKTNPDILGTQEVLENQRKDLKKLLPAYDVFGAGRNNGKHAGEHSSVFYKRAQYEFIKGGNFWLSETPSVAGSKSWDAAITRICTWVKLKDKIQGVEFYVFNTHFDHRGKEARVKSAALLCRMVDSISIGHPVIVMGDFNFTSDSPAYVEVTNQNQNHEVSLQDSYTADSPDYTDCGFEVSNKNCNRIDYIFHNNRYAASNYILHTDNNGTYYPSDHLTISVDLKLILLKK